MKIPSASVAFLSLLLAASGVRADDNAPKSPAGAPPAKAPEEQTELGEHMERIGRSFRALNRELADPAKHQEAIKHAAIIHKNAEAALTLTPEKAADIPAADRAKFIADYHEDMKHFIGDVEKLQVVLQAGNNDEAAKLLKAMKSDMEEGHKEFRKKKKHPGWGPPPAANAEH